jgi:hypothetical protein
MPIEIRELLIRVTVNQPQQGDSEANPITGQTGDGKDKDAIIAQCIEEALRIIDQREER